MKKISILTAVISLLFANLQAQQQSDILNIRKWYNETKKDIAFAQKNQGEGTLYCDVIEKNVHNASWRAVGQYHIKKQMWYNDQMDFLDNPREGLNMVIINVTRSVREEYSEYLYHKGKLVFMYYKDALNEMRFYFKNGKLIKKLEKLGNDEEALTEKDAQRNSEIYMKQYLNEVVSSMLEEK